MVNQLTRRIYQQGEGYALCSGPPKSNTPACGGGLDPISPSLDKRSSWTADLLQTTIHGDIIGSTRKRRHPKILPSKNPFDRGRSKSGAAQRERQCGTCKYRAMLIKKILDRTVSYNPVNIWSFYTNHRLGVFFQPTANCPEKRHGIRNMLDCVTTNHHVRPSPPALMIADQNSWYEIVWKPQRSERLGRRDQSLPRYEAARRPVRRHKPGTSLGRSLPPDS